MTELVALDDFAGTGWGVACQRLGIPETGVEIMPEARATRAAAGMNTAEIGDVWAHIGSSYRASEYTLYIASPPCQTFSMAGSGAGRKALDTVLSLIDDRAYLRIDDLLAFGEQHDPRTALVLAPLVRIAQDMPPFVVLEQVPPVLPVWERYAEEMRRWGYSVWTGILNAEQYGVPQTRRRAVLIARADGIEAAPPVPTHSKFYTRDKTRLDPDVAKWVSMAEALGWEGEAVVMRSNYGTAVVTSGQIPRETTEPAHTITGAGSAAWVHERPSPTVVGTRRSSGGLLIGRQLDDSTRQDVGGHKSGVGLREGMLAGVRVTIAEASILQSYPADFPWQGNKGSQAQQIGNAVPPKLAEAILGVFA